MTREALEAALADFVRRLGMGKGFGLSAKQPPTRVVLDAARERLAQLPEKCPQQSCNDGLNTGSFRQGVADCRTCHGSGKVYPPETVEKIADALLDLSITEGHMLAKFRLAQRPNALRKAVAVLDALGETE